MSLKFSVKLGFIPEEQEQKVITLLQNVAEGIDNTYSSSRSRISERSATLTNCSQALSGVSLHTQKPAEPDDTYKCISTIFIDSQKAFNKGLLKDPFAIQQPDFLDSEEGKAFLEALAQHINLPAEKLLNPSISKLCTLNFSLDLSDYTEELHNSLNTLLQLTDLTPRPAQAGAKRFVA